MPNTRAITDAFFGAPWKYARIQGMKWSNQWVYGDPQSPEPPNVAAIPNLLTWLKASIFDFPPDGQPHLVDSWYDSSGNGRGATLAAGSTMANWTYSQMNGRPCLHFGDDGITDFVVDPRREIGDRTIFLAFQIDPYSQTPYGPFHAVQLQPLAPFMRTYVRNGTIRTYASPELDSGVTLESTGGIHLMALWCNTAAKTQGVEVDGTVVTSTWNPSKSAAPFHIGGYRTGGYGMKGQLGEVLIFDRCLSDEERAEVQRYMSIAWYGG